MKLRHKEVKSPAQVMQVGGGGEPGIFFPVLLGIIDVQLLGIIDV